MTPKQKRFVDEYMVDLNATAAAIRAGYSENSARISGSENLASPKVAAEIAKRQQKVAEDTDTSIERVIRKLSKIAFADIDITNENAKLLAVQAKALVDLGKHLGGFVQRAVVDLRDIDTMTEDQMRAELVEIMSDPLVRAEVERRIGAIPGDGASGPKPH